MKKSLLFVMLILSSMGFAQTGFNYKALIANGGSVLNNQTVNIKFTVLENGTTNVYQETHSATTDANGIVSVIVGEGNMVSGDFTTIDWGNNPYFLKVEIDSGSGYQNFGTNELKAVPYAKFAEKAGNTFSGSFNDLTNVPSGLADGDDDTQLTETQVDNYVANNGYLTSEVDGSTTNELQTISKSGSTVTLSNGGGTFTDAVNDADHSTTNELQTLSVNGTQLSISNGNTVTLPTGSGGDQWGSQVVQSNTSLSGNGTSGSPLAVNTSSTVFSGWDKNASDDFSGNYSDLNGTPTNVSSFTNDAGYLTNATLPDQTDADFYKTNSTTQLTNINDDIYTMGNLAIGKNTADYPLDIHSTIGGVNLEIISGSSNNGYQTGFSDILSGQGSGDQY